MKNNIITKTVVAVVGCAIYDVTLKPVVRKLGEKSREKRERKNNK